jgi:hypothetical protein
MCTAARTILTYSHRVLLLTYELTLVVCCRIYITTTINRKLPFMDAPTQIDLHSMLEELELEDLISSCDNVSEHFR